MNKERKELSSREKIEYGKNEMKNIIDGAKIAIQEEFSRSPNNRTACFKSIIFQLEMNLSVVQKCQEGEHIVYDDKIDNKIEDMKIEAARLGQLYPEKNTEPTDEEKENLFKCLTEIKEIIN
ncbi:MAG: hypothetical protein NT085_03780 [candidate division SR1 bacterium]|nr:hypothetical protein [candidate division SR1 bacterium]